MTKFPWFDQPPDLATRMSRSYLGGAREHLRLEIVVLVAAGPVSVQVDRGGLDRRGQLHRQPGRLPRILRRGADQDVGGEAR